VASVPDTASVIKVGGDGKGIDETGIKWIVSPYDEYALEAALQITERGFQGNHIRGHTWGRTMSVGLCIHVALLFI
jgi:electron transfer flavoprotein beta subunit